MNQQITIPEGYMQNSRGDLVREENVKELDKIMNQAAIDLAEQAKAIHMQLAKFKRQALDDVRDLIQIAGEKYDKKLGGEKGNTTITSFDGRYRIQRTFAERISFGLELKATEALFEDYLDSVTASVDGDVRALIKGAFKTTRGDNLRTAELLRLLKIEIKHPAWVKACEALKDSLTCDGTTVYIRVYERVNNGESYRQIPLDLANAGGGYAR